MLDGQLFEALFRRALLHFGWNIDITIDWALALTRPTCWAQSQGSRQSGHGTLTSWLQIERPREWRHQPDYLWKPLQTTPPTERELSQPDTQHSNNLIKDYTHQQSGLIWSHECRLLPHAYSDVWHSVCSHQKWPEFRPDSQQRSEANWKKGYITAGTHQIICPRALFTYTLQKPTDSTELHSSSEPESFASPMSLLNENTT